MTSKSSTKAVRLVELLIILFVSIVPLIFNSIATNIFEYQSIAQEQYDFGFIRSIISYSTGICLLLYILSKQKRNIKDIGLRFHSKDLIVALILYITMNFNLMSYMLIRNYFWKSEYLGLKACNIEALPAKLSIWCVLYVLISPIFEELIVRAYTMTEIEYLTSSNIIAILASLILQVSYHSYQGEIALFAKIIIFLPLAIYFAIWKRATPVIMAHLLFDLGTLF